MEEIKIEQVHQLGEFMYQTLLRLKTLEILVHGSSTNEAYVEARKKALEHVNSEAFVNSLPAEIRTKLTQSASR